MQRTGAYLTQPLHRLVREMPDAVASVDRGRSRTWAEVHDRVRRLAGWFVEGGLQAGDRVALLAPNGDIYLEAMFGILWAGGVFTPINTRLSAAEMTALLNDCGATYLIVDRDLTATGKALQSSVKSLHAVLSADDAPAGCRAYEECIRAGPPIDDTLRAGDDLAAILYTGGTTGAPKGVMLSHRSITASALNHVGAPGCAPGASMMHTAPLFHIGAISGLFAAMLARSRHIFIPGFQPEPVMQSIQQQRVTDIFLVPTMIQALLDHPRLDDYDLSSVERIIYGASPISPALMDRIVAAMPGVGFIQAYGMTELSPIATLLLPSDHDAAAYASGRIRSAGRAGIMAEVRVADDEGRELPRGAVGEILVRGDTAEALRGGWMHTGDLGRMDGDGYLYVVDRLKDMIVSGGENIYSAEVEAALASHPSVQSCAVVGIADERWGEAVHAVVVPRAGWAIDDDELIAHCRLTIAGYKCPRSLEVRTALPISGAGKVLKAQLRAEARQISTEQSNTSAGSASS